MTISEDHKTEFVRTIDHLEKLAGKIAKLLGRGGTLTFPDHHKLSEGLFLSAWTQWEEFIRELIIDDLSEEPGGFVRKDVREFRLKGAPRRIAERILLHPDHPERFVEWDYSLVKKRAGTLLPETHRFKALPRDDDLEKMKRIRNAVAHKSDKAWESFRRLVSDPPFRLTSSQRKGLTVGRFLVAHQWNGKSVLMETFAVHRAHAQHLVP